MILVGEMRDFETIETALLAAETGHLVFSTLHTLDATETINRIIAVFPPHQQKQVRLQLAAVLKAVISQRLMPRADGSGRVPAVEVMVAHPFIRDCIVDKEKTHLIPSAIASGTSQYGMQTFDQSIFGLYQQGLVTFEEALRWASNVDEFKLRVQGISMTADMARDQMAPASSGGGVPEHPRLPGARRDAVRPGLTVDGAAPRHPGSARAGRPGSRRLDRRACGCSAVRELSEAQRPGSGSRGAASTRRRSTPRWRGCAESGALDDARVAPQPARVPRSLVRGRGRLRALPADRGARHRRRGAPTRLSTRSLADVDERGLVERALDRRLARPCAARRSIGRAVGRLYRHLVGQGFPPGIGHGRAQAPGCRLPDGRADRRRVAGRVARARRLTLQLSA